MTETTEPAKIGKVDIGFEDHGIFTMDARFDFGHSMQGFGYCIELEFIKRFIKACGKDYLSQCSGQIVMVTHTNTSITKIAPMPFNDGKTFDIKAWGDELKGDKL